MTHQSGGMGNTLLRTHRPLCCLIFRRCSSILPSLHDPQVYVPDPGAHFLESDMFARHRVGHASPVLLPSDAAVVTDEPRLEVSGVLDRHRSSGGYRGDGS